MTSRVLHKL